MVVVGLVFAAFAALIHVYIFVLESIGWTGETARRTFGIESRDVAEVTKPLAFNQGFYNLFLSLATAIGIIAFAAGATTVGATLVFTGAGSMVAAGLVLLLSDRSKASAALKQLVPPAIGIISLAIGLTL
jgi:putative membrane protein